ncbi:MAG: NAD(+)/NADH kinase [Lachnospiraceae bacterium]|nr:NAD(+)/NADH kinase [Lachnospiraceae bacterium]
MKNFYIIISENKNQSIENTTEKLIERFDTYGSRVSYEIYEGYLGRDFQIPEHIDCVITVGGDGTMLRAARAAFGRSVAFIGINRGHMGYLTEVSEISDYGSLVERLINDDFQIEERMMLAAKLKRDGKVIFRDFALNDVLLGKNDSIHMMEYEVYVNDTLLNTYRADGVLVASPTGSTGYSLSAGGPIAEPSAKLLILTPICPHSINTRSIVLSASDKVRIIPHTLNQLVSCDGADGTEVKKGDELIVTRSTGAMKFIKLKETSFLDTLRDKMRAV